MTSGYPSIPTHVKRGTHAKFGSPRFSVLAVHKGHRTDRQGCRQEVNFIGIDRLPVRSPLASVSRALELFRYVPTKLCSVYLSALHVKCNVLVHG